ncbi:MAG: hypothetical protein GWO24_31045 [Akkermansiaceae bacterium]|nr:hypothetical protein [Akkermansiaceae bacterium]NIS11200.1 hypothetical protein [Thermoplasmata archaeon]NIS19138.1 hypothetical protein [Thermoplasmata archaeon]NIT76194.1 hypothetical protein [Thermoplasmata archaeon]NIY02565.1 hypothetical protein [Thermoplasmata archaeon]
MESKQPIEKQWIEQVILTPWEMALGATVGVQRFYYALRKRLPQRDGRPQEELTRKIRGVERFSDDIRGALGELVVAKYFNTYWSGTVGETNRPDLVVNAHEIEVRTGKNPGMGLWVKDRDPDARICVLVTGDGPLFEIRGGILAVDGKTWERAGRTDPFTGKENHLVDQSALIPIVRWRAYVYGLAELPIYRGTP